MLGYIKEQFLSEPHSLQWVGGGVGMFEHGRAAFFGVNMWIQSNQMLHIGSNWELPPGIIR